jgi:hypothetical protein
LIRKNKYREQQIALLKRNAAKLGLQILEPLNGPAELERVVSGQ